MNLLFSCIGKRGYIADFFREQIGKNTKIIGTSNTEWTPGFASCDSSVIMPSINSDEYISCLLNVCKKHSIRGILSFFDPDVYEISKSYETLAAKGIIPILPRFESAKACFDKLQTFAFLRSKGFLVPETTNSFEEAVRLLERGDLCFPLIVKPRYGFASINTFIARTIAELSVFFNYAEEMIVQQFLEGKAVNVDALGDLNGNPIKIVAWEKLLSLHGETERAITIKHNELIQLAAELIRTIQIIGPCDIDFIETTDGLIYTIELNPRFGGGYPLSHLAGGDFPRLICQLMRSKIIQEDIDKYESGVTMMKRLQIIPGPKV